uniref:Transposase n=1 Tax=Heterorhabditis bacteriophora TaxID=37862 RepID=A0A1I7WIF1_HETBA
MAVDRCGGALRYINLCIDRTLATSRLRSPKIGRIIKGETRE